MRERKIATKGGICNLELVQILKQHTYNFFCKRSEKN